MRTALAIIDIQSYFLEWSPKDLPTRIANHIKSVKYDCVLFTVFFNPKGSNYERSLHWQKSRGEEDLKLPDEFKQFVNKDNVFKKSTYSAFKAAGVERYLQGHNINKIEICGIDSDACVLATAYEAFDKNYEVNILFDLSYSRHDLQEGVKAIATKNLLSRNYEKA